jgi:hypothetical protein
MARTSNQARTVYRDEMSAAKAADTRDARWYHLERAHIVSQPCLSRPTSPPFSDRPADDVCGPNGRNDTASPCQFTMMLVGGPHSVVHRRVQYRS